METGDWRLKQSPHLRPKVIDKMVNKLKEAYNISKPDDENQLRAMITGFEENIYNTSTSDVHYAQRLMEKMQFIEYKFAERKANSSAIGGQNFSRHASSSMQLQQNQGQQLLPLKTVHQSQAYPHSLFQNIIPSTVHNSATLSATRSLSTETPHTGMVMSPMAMVNQSRAHPQTLPQKIISSTNFVGQSANLLSNMGGIRHNSEGNSFPVRVVQPYVLSNTQGQHQLQNLSNQFAKQEINQQPQHLSDQFAKQEIYQLPQHLSNQFAKQEIYQHPPQHQGNMQSSTLETHLHRQASLLRYKQLQQATSSVPVTGGQDQEQQLAHYNGMQQAEVVASQQNPNQQTSSTVLASLPLQLAKLPQANSASTHLRIQTPTSSTQRIETPTTPTHSKIQTSSNSLHEFSTSDQQDQHLFQAQTRLPKASLSELEASNAVTAQTDQVEIVGQEECYQKLQLLKNKYFMVINNIHKNIIANSGQEQKREAKNSGRKTTELILNFLNSPKSYIGANFEMKIGKCEKLIVEVLSAVKCRTRSGEQHDTQTQLRSKQSSPTTSISTPLTTTMGASQSQQGMQSHENVVKTSPANAMHSLQQNIVNTSQQARFNTLSLGGRLQPNMNTYQSNARILQEHTQKQQPEQDWKRQLFIGYPQRKQQLQLHQRGQLIQKMPQNHQASNHVNELTNPQRLPNSNMMPQHHHQSNQMNASYEQSSQKSRQLSLQVVQQNLAVAAGIPDSPTTVLPPHSVEIETPKQDPFDRLIKTIKSMSPDRFRSRASDIRSAVIEADTMSELPPGSESGSNVGEDSTAIASHKLRAEDSPDDGPPVAKKMKLEFDSTPPNVPSVNHSLIEELKEINLSLLETAVEIIDEDDDSVAEAPHSKGTVVKCTYTAVTISCELKSQLAAAQMEPNMTLKLLVPTNYPSCFPVPLDELPAETSISKEMVDIFAKAKYKFGVALAASAQSMPLRKMASTWDACARQVIIEFAERRGGGTFSSRFGIWKKC